MAGSQNEKESPSDLEPEDGSGPSLLTKAYRKDPSIENYVALRRERPDQIIEVSVSGGIEWLFANADKLKRFGISPSLYEGAIYAIEEDVSELSLKLLELLIERDRLVASGQTHLIRRGNAISDGFVDHIVNHMLDALDQYDHFIPGDLIVLIRHQMVGRDTEWNDEATAVKRWREVTQAIVQIAARGGCLLIAPSAKN